MFCRLTGSFCIHLCARHVHERRVRAGQGSIFGGDWRQRRLPGSHLQPWTGEHAHWQLVAMQALAPVSINGHQLLHQWSLLHLVFDPPALGWNLRQVPRGTACFWQAPFHHSCELCLGCPGMPLDAGPGASKTVTLCWRVWHVLTNKICFIAASGSQGEVMWQLGDIHEKLGNHAKAGKRGEEQDRNGQNLFYIYIYIYIYHYI